MSQERDQAEAKATGQPIVPPDGLHEFGVPFTRAGGSAQSLR